MQFTLLNQTKPIQTDDHIINGGKNDKLFVPFERIVFFFFGFCFTNTQFFSRAQIKVQYRNTFWCYKINVKHPKFHVIKNINKKRKTKMDDR